MANPSDALHSLRKALTRRNPSRAIHPTIFLAAWAVVGFGLGALWPLPFLPAPLASGLGAPILVAGGVLMAWAQLEFWRHGTTVDHRQPTTALITRGPFRLTRNPVYVALVAIMVGLALVQESFWALVLAAPVVVAIHRLTVVQEEAYLEREFGEAYVRYRASVRRWL